MSTSLCTRLLTEANKSIVKREPLLFQSNKSITVQTVQCRSLLVRSRVLLETGQLRPELGGFLLLVASVRLRFRFGRPFRDYRSRLERFGETHQRRDVGAREILNTHGTVEAAHKSSQSDRIGSDRSMVFGSARCDSGGPKTMGDN